MGREGWAPSSYFQPVIIDPSISPLGQSANFSDDDGNFFVDEMSICCLPIISVHFREADPEHSYSSPNVAPTKL